MIVGHLRWNTHKACRVDWSLKVHLESLELWLVQIDWAVHFVGVHLGHFDIDAAEHPKGRQTWICIVYVRLAVYVPRNYRIQVFQYTIPDFQALGVLDFNIVDDEFPERHSVFRRGVPRVFIDCQIKRGLARDSKGVGLIEIIVFGESVESTVPQISAGTFRLLFKGCLRQVIPWLYGRLGCVGKEIIRQLPFRKMIVYTADAVTVSKFDGIVDIDPFLLHFDWRGHFRIVISEIIQMTGDVVYGTFNHIRIIYDRSDSYFLYKSVPPFPFAVGPVVYIQERVPSEYEIWVRTLLQIRLDLSGIEFPVIRDFKLVFCKTIFPVLQDTCRTAGNRRQNHRQQHYKIYCYLPVHSLKDLFSGDTALPRTVPSKRGGKTILQIYPNKS